MNPVYTLLLSLPLLSSSFAPAVRISLAKNGTPSSLHRPIAATIVGRPSSSLMAAKKRRRRKADTAPVPTTQSDELPDFDDPEAEDAAEESSVEAAKTVSPMKMAAAAMPSTSKSITPVRRGAGLNAQLAEEVGGNVDGLDQDTILEAMRGKSNASWQPPRSIQETLGDRSLEKFMDFEKMIEQDGAGGGAIELPDFDEVISQRKQREAMQEGRVEDAAMLMDTTGLGKKAARNAQRKAEAMQREAEIEAEKSPFEGVNILKLLENGAWVGIGLLVLWEVYINSPLFDRASPIIPVVYEFLV